MNKCCICGKDVDIEDENVKEMTIEGFSGLIHWICPRDDEDGK